MSMCLLSRIINLNFSSLLPSWFSAVSLSPTTCLSLFIHENPQWVAWCRKLFPSSWNRNFPPFFVVFVIDVIPNGNNYFLHDNVQRYDNSIVLLGSRTACTHISFHLYIFRQNSQLIIHFFRYFHTSHDIIAWCLTFHPKIMNETLNRTTWTKWNCKRAEETTLLCTIGCQIPLSIRTDIINMQFNKNGIFSLCIKFDKEEKETERKVIWRKNGIFVSAYHWQ